MKRFAASLFGISLTLFSVTIFADSGLRVDALNYPAWLVREYQTIPLQPGTRLQNNDLVRTGEGGRVQLVLDDGSAVRLGESTRFMVNRTQASAPAADSSFPASFHALRGVFRVSSVIPEAAAPEGLLELRVGEIKALFRKADFWAKADLTRDAVCLLEGELSIEDPSRDRIALSEALSCFLKPKGKASLPVDLVDLEQHKLWLAETELMPDSGIARENGQWQLVLISLTNGQRAGELLMRFRQQGFAAMDKTVVRDGRTLHRLLLPGFVSTAAALNARKHVERQLGVSKTWVWKAN